MVDVNGDVMAKREGTKRGREERQRGEEWRRDDDLVSPAPALLLARSLTQSSSL